MANTAPSHPVRPCNPLLDVHLPLLGVQICFSILPIASKLAYRAFSPESIVFFRIVGTALTFAVLFFLRRFEPVQRTRDYLVFAALAAFGVAGNQMFFLKGLSLTTAANAGLLIATIPVFTLLWAILMKHETISLAKGAGVVIAFSGIGVLFDPRHFEMGPYLLGNSLIVLNTFLYSFYLVAAKPVLARYRPLTVITWVFLFGALEILPFSLPQVVRHPYAAVSAGAWRALLVTVVVGTIFPYILNTVALRSARATLVAIYTYTQPLLITVLSVIILHDRLSLRFFAAAVLILGGITLVNLRAREKGSCIEEETALPAE